jgi:hypothetical protein
MWQLGTRNTSDVEEEERRKPTANTWKTRLGSLHLAPWTVRFPQRVACCDGVVSELATPRVYTTSLLTATATATANADADADDDENPGGPLVSPAAVVHIFRRHGTGRAEHRALLISATARILAPGNGDFHHLLRLCLCQWPALAHPLCRVSRCT